MCTCNLFYCCIFQTSVANLMKNLLCKNPNYIRCITVCTCTYCTYLHIQYIHVLYCMWCKELTNVGVVGAQVTLGECFSGETTPSSTYMYINIHYQPHILTHYMYIQPNDLKDSRNQGTSVKNWCVTRPTT